MSRRIALVVSLLLAVAAAAGTFAVLSTAALRAAPTKPQVFDARALARRSRELDAWAASLVKAARARPPALPPIPRYAPIVPIRAARLAALPAVVSLGRSGIAARVVDRAGRTASGGDGSTRAMPTHAPAASVSIPAAAAPGPASTAAAPTATTAAPTTTHGGEGGSHSDDGGGTDD